MTLWQKCSLTLVSPICFPLITTGIMTICKSSTKYNFEVKKPIKEIISDELEC
jgi:hypothetical protein